MELNSGAYAKDGTNNQALHRVSLYKIQTTHLRNCLDVCDAGRYDVECTSGGPDSAMFSCPAPGVDRFHMKAVIPASDFVDYYLAPFRKTFSEAKPASIMCSFNTVNNTPSCSNGLLSNTIARDEFGFDGFIVTDCGGIPFLQQGHYWVNGGPPAAVAGALKNGTDAECGIPGPWGVSFFASPDRKRQVN